MGKVANTNFFKQRICESKKSSPKIETSSASESPINSGINISSSLVASLNETVQTLTDVGRKNAAAEIKKICNNGLRNRFSVAVVGEFSRGKSTFINTLLDCDALPVGDLPTTAMLTRIRYNTNECIIHFNTDNQKESVLPISESSWDGLIAENLGKNDPTGTILMGVDNSWLSQYNIEVMDTPGAGDLEEKRAQIIGDALLGCDGAIITVSATAPLSLSEKLFIEQRLISRKTPFLMLIITKLDMVEKEERAGVIEYITQKLSSWNMDIPVFVPYDVELDTDQYKDIVGVDKIKKRIVSWVNHPQRLKLTEDWIIGQALSVIQREVSSLKEQKLLFDAEDKKRDELINEKKTKLKKAEIFWEDLRLKMLARCNKCYEQLLSKVDDCGVAITERLQYEVSHSNSPSKWWKEDYSYRLKVELTNMATGIENSVSRIIAEDVKWFNMSLEHNFNTHILSERETIYDKEIVSEAMNFKELEFENLDKKKTLARVGTAVASIAGFAICASSGFLPIIATMGVGTGASILTEGVFKKKIEHQRETIKTTIANEVPRIISDATAESELRLKSVYDDILKSAAEKEVAWKNAQLAAIENSVKPDKASQGKTLDAKIDSLQNLMQKMMSI